MEQLTFGDLATMYSSMRGIGHTKLMAEGANKRDDVVVVVSDKRMGKAVLKKHPLLCRARILQVSELKSWMQGSSAPITWDNSALQQIFYTGHKMEQALRRPMRVTRAPTDIVGLGRDNEGVAAWTRRIVPLWEGDAVGVWENWKRLTLTDVPMGQDVRDTCKVGAVEFMLYYSGWATIDMPNNRAIIGVHTEIVYD